MGNGREGIDGFLKPCFFEHAGNPVGWQNRAGRHGLHPSLARYLADVTNQPPVAANDQYTGVQGNRLTIAAPGVLGNDTNPDLNTTLNAVPVSGTLHGTLGLGSNGFFFYEPQPVFSGNDSFTYKAASNGILSNVATVTIRIQSLADYINAQQVLNKGKKESLTKKLANAEALFASGQTKAACNILGAFLNEVKALSGPVDVDPNALAILRNGAIALMGAYGCS